jgi:hypothetical protein
MRVVSEYLGGGEVGKPGEVMEAADVPDPVSRADLVTVAVKRIFVRCVSVGIWFR